jgi:catechol 2,3-dioxygenase-like lactoylglutathione lyase family enzyme
MTFHHVELWVPDLAGSLTPWGWLMTSLGWTLYQEWPRGRSWRDGDVYLVLEQSPSLNGNEHDRTAPGLNHVAFTVAGPAEVDRLCEEAPAHGWSLLFPDRHPYAGGKDSYAAYLEDNWGYEVELQSSPPS